MFTIYEMELFQIFNTFQPSLFQLRQVIFIIQTFQNLFVTGFRCGIFLFEIMKDISNTNTVTTNFICICRTNTLTGSSYFGIPFGSFIGSVKDTMCRKNQVSLL